MSEGWNRFFSKRNSKHRNVLSSSVAPGLKKCPFEPRWHNSSTVASTKPTAYIMDWALILGAIIYLSHIRCQMDVCPEKKVC